MTDSTVTIQVNPESVPSIPSWLAEGAAFAQVLISTGILKAIQERVQFARARFGQYDTIDFVVVLIGYGLSGEGTLQAFYERLLPFADTFMALFGRHHLPSRSALSRWSSCPRSSDGGVAADAFSRRSRQAPACWHFPRWLIGSTGQSLVSGGCRCHQTSRTSTSAAPTEDRSRPLIVA